MKFMNSWNLWLLKLYFTWNVKYCQAQVCKLRQFTAQVELFGCRSVYKYLLLTGAHDFPF